MINYFNFSTSIGWIAILYVVNILLIFAVIFTERKSPSATLAWVMVLAFIPIVGFVFYIVFNQNFSRSKINKLTEKEEVIVSKALKKQIERINDDDYKFARPETKIWKHLIKLNQVYGHSFYTENNNVELITDGVELQNKLLNDIKNAKKSVDVEYYIIKNDFVGMKLINLLTEKAKEGVAVRLIYDDVGSMGFINTDFVKQMESQGIQCRIFNKIVPFVNMFMNNRDHRKITVIDGQVGFTGGYNLADEYFNITHPYGLWKDTGVRMEGDAVRSLTVMFLEMWNAIKKTDTDYTAYFPEITYTAKQTGYVQPYADNPLDDEHTGENVYMNVLNSAREYAYFITPYLLISDEMKKAFTLAARRGVDVRIITPGIPDKKFVYQATRSYYNRLVKKGVRIFEYTPGFCHAKQCVSDDKAAVVGTINLDYRSLYHHFENAAAFYHKDAVAGVKADFDHLFEECHEVTEQYRSHRSTALRIGQCILRLFAPLL